MTSLLLGTSAGEYVKQISRTLNPKVPSTERYLALLHGYCDESYDGKNIVYTLAGFLADENEWSKLADLWSNRCLLDGISCYHATDCAGQWNEFKHLSEDACIALNKDLLTFIEQSHVVGFGVSISYKDFETVYGADQKSKDFLGPSPYYLAMQVLALRFCHEIKQNGGTRMAFFFDRNEEVSGRAKIIYDKVRARNPQISPLMGSLTYDCRCELTPLQIADELAFESMKNAQGRLDGRMVDRKPIARLKAAGRLGCLEMLGKKELEQMINNGKLFLEG